MSIRMHKRKDKEGPGQSAHVRCLNGTLYCHVVLNCLSETSSKNSISVQNTWSY